MLFLPKLEKANIQNHQYHLTLLPPRYEKADVIIQKHSHHLTLFSPELEKADEHIIQNHQHHLTLLPPQQPGHFTGWGSERVNDDNNDNNGTLIQCLP